MSKNITIQEGGVAKQLTADKLKTNMVGGGTCFWVPEDETRLVSKHITENGEYYAEDDEYYGYSSVEVSIAGGYGSADEYGLPTGDIPSGGIGSSIIGVDPLTGNEIAVGIDSNGNVVTTVLPSHIIITTPPTTTRYNAGDTIDYSGIVVQAYKNDGTLWTEGGYANGIIPYNELRFPETTAEADSSSQMIYTDGDGIHCLMMYVSQRTISGRPENDWSGYAYGTPIGQNTLGIPTYFILKNGTATILVTKYNGVTYYCKAKNSGTGGNPSYLTQLQIPDTGKWYWHSSTSGIQFDEYWRSHPLSYCEGGDIIPTSTKAPTGSSDDLHYESGGQLIPVEWANAGRLLSDSFAITVIQSGE